MNGTVSLESAFVTPMTAHVRSALKYAAVLVGGALVYCMPFSGSMAATSGTVATKQFPDTVTVINLSNASLQQLPITFAQPFRAGDIPHSHTIVAYADGKPLPTQANIKARNPDGSVRHAVLTVLLPTLSGDASETFTLRTAPDVGTTAEKIVKLGELLQSGFDAAVSVNISGQAWQLDARTLLQKAAQDQACKPYAHECNLWLSGPLVSEWVVGGPLLNADGQPHPHLAAYFAVRAYGPAPVKRVRVDVIVENDWAYAPDPHNITYDAQILVGKQEVYKINNLEHVRQARWHKVFWWGLPDPVYAQLSSRYLQDSLAVPRYADMQASTQVLENVEQRLNRVCVPMQRCDQSKDMSTVGAQPGIGPLPRWSSFYVIDPEYRAFQWMLANSDALGSYPVHYRDQLTGQPISVEAHPCATLVVPAEVPRCPVPPHANDNFPRCKLQCRSPLIPNEAHHPAPAYVAYLVTGDWYYLQELKFWSDWVVFQQNPAYRNYTQGLVARYTLRGQGWALRTLGYAAYILPDNDPLKGYLNRVVGNNIAWYNAHYTDNPDANALHIITNGYALSYPDNGRGPPNTGIATWQASFFTWSVGNLKDLGFTGASRLLDWVAAFQINLIASPDYCWVLASAYQVQVRDTEKSPIYASLSSVYANTFPELKGVSCGGGEMARLLTKPRGYHYAPGEMLGYPASPTGFPANFQIGLAAAADSNVPNARRAWSIFKNRSAKPDYARSPQFAVVPRH